MKRLTIIAALLMMVMPMMAKRVTPETARKVATTFLNNNGAKATQLTDLSKTVGFPNLYIFTAEQSFVVMSADDCVQPILGYSLNGSFDTNDMPENVRGWLQGYSDEIQFAIDNQMRATSETAKQWKDLMEGNTKAGKATTVVEPLIQTEWNQNGGYYGSTYVFLFNNLCPLQPNNPSRNCATGCVATAMAQIMKYWGQPAHGIGSHSYIWNNQTLSADFANTNYDWTHMTNTYGKNSTETAKLAVATLMYHCGISVDMSYGSSSSASTAAVAEALKTYFNYSPDIEYLSKNDYDNDTWTNMVKDELDAGRPLQYRGSTGSGGGHSFVCDGYDSNNKFHFNWGWGGSLDGYFSLDNLDTGANTQTGAGNGDYTDDQAAIFGIQPVQCAASEPTNLTYTLNGLQNITLSWTAASGAASYNIYRNNNYIGNSATTSYTETAPFGSNTYYVRSVDDAGNLSLSSNNVSVFIGYQHPVVDDLGATLDGNNVNLLWTAPEWCYPETSSATLNYGNGNVHYLWTSKYYGHRHLASNLTQYEGMVVYKVSTFILYSGTYSIYVYTKSTQSGQPDPESLAFSKTQVPINNTNGWYEFDTDAPIILTGTDDLWVVMKQENTGQTYAAPSFDLTSFNENACYAGSSSPTSLSSIHIIQEQEFLISWLINVHLTDGTYTYNLYDNETPVASNISDTTYTVSNIADNAIHQYTVKTNYYNGESTASNTASLALGTASLETLILGDNDKMTITEGSKLTVSGTLSNNNAANLLIENGAQLVTSNPVAVTMEKKIVGFGNNNNAQTGWYTIATPFTTNVTPAGNMLENTFDLYLYDEENVKWRNYKQEESEYYHFNIEPNKGYLYANSENTTLSFADTVRASNASITIPLSYASTNENKKGFNLVGNPFSCELTGNSNITMGGTLFSTYYIADGTISDGKNLIACNISDRPIKPGEGFIVQATGENQSLVFNGRSLSEQKGYISIEAGNENFTDRAFVQIGGGNTLRKITLSDNTAQVYVMQDNMDFAAVMIEETQGVIPVNFRAAEDGSFTLTINPEGVEMNYLHLIDNMTGSDVDLLTNPSYTFEAKTTDYESRFKLVFASGSVFGDDASTGSASFAFFNNGQWIINNNGESTVQVLDVTGHILRSERVNGVCDIQINYAPGVYVLRLIDGEKVRTQKIVIE